MKTLPQLLVFTLFLSFSEASAQLTAPEIEWQNTIGGSSDDFLYSVQQTSDGGYLLGGSS